MTKEEAKYIIDALDAKGKARDAKGRFVSKEQIELARKTLEATETTKKSLGNVTESIKQQNAKLDAVKNLQELQKDGQKELAKNEKKLLTLQQKAKEDRTDDHKEQVEKQEKLVEQGKKTVGELKTSIVNQVEGLNSNQKRVLKLDEQKEELQELKTLLESQGQIAEENKEYRKKSLEIAEEEYRLKKATPGLSLSQRKELEKERLSNIKKQGTLLQKGFAGIRLGLKGLGEKFGAGAMSAGKAILTFLGLGALLLFLKSETWAKMREFLKDPSWVTFQKIWEKDGEKTLMGQFFEAFQKFVQDEIWGDMLNFFENPNLINFKKIWTQETGENKGGWSKIGLAIISGLALVAAAIVAELALLAASLALMGFGASAMWARAFGPKPPKPPIADPAGGGGPKIDPDKRPGENRKQRRTREANEKKAEKRRLRAEKAAAERKRQQKVTDKTKGVGKTSALRRLLSRGGPLAAVAFLASDVAEAGELDDPDEREEANVNAVANAVSALTTFGLLDLTVPVGKVMGYESAAILELQRKEAQDFVNWMRIGTKEERLMKKTLFFPDAKNPLFMSASKSQAAEQLRESTAAAKEFHEQTTRRALLDLSRKRERGNGNAIINAPNIKGGSFSSNSSTHMSKSIIDSEEYLATAII